MGTPLARVGGAPLRRERPGAGVRHRHAAADRLGLAARRARLQLHADGRPRAAPAHARARTSSTRWAGTTTACRPSGASRTSTTCAARPTRRYEPGLDLAMADDAGAQAAAPPDLPRELHRALPRAHRRGREGLQGAVAAPRALGGLARSSTPRSTSAAVARRSRASWTCTARGRCTRSRRRPCGTWTSRPRWRRPRSRTGRRRAPSTTCASGSRAAASFVVATTRPELLPACVGVAAHPDDARYRSLFGKRAVTPLFRVPVPIFPSELVDREKGTGILMVCTFGDATDVEWWREQGLALRQVMGRDGHLSPVEFGASSSRASMPRRRTRRTRTWPARRSRRRRRPSWSCCATRPGARRARASPRWSREPQPLEHPVKFYEKGDRPLEFITTRQWFVRILEHKQALVEAGERVAWHPEFMGRASATGRRT